MVISQYAVLFNLTNVFDLWPGQQGSSISFDNVNDRFVFAGKHNTAACAWFIADFKAKDVSAVLPQSCSNWPLFAVQVLPATNQLYGIYQPYSYQMYSVDLKSGKTVAI